MDYNANIELRYYTDEWGPFSIDLDGGLKDDDVIANVNIRAFVGRVSPNADLSELTDVSAQVIEDGSVGYSELSVWWKMQYPEDTTLKGKSLTLIFEITTSSGGKYPFYFYRARVV